MRALSGQLAQLVEQRIENPRVRGSIPRLATKDSSKNADPSGRRFCVHEAEMLGRWAPGAVVPLAPREPRLNIAAADSDCS